VLQSARSSPAARERCAPHRRYARRQPETTLPHRLVREHLEAFCEQVHTETGTALPDYIAAEFDGYRGQDYSNACSRLTWNVARIAAARSNWAAPAHPCARGISASLHVIAAIE
jgi:hypothetical protein